MFVVVESLQQLGGVLPEKPLEKHNPPIREHELPFVSPEEGTVNYLLAQGKKGRGIN